MKTRKLSRVETLWKVSVSQPLWRTRVRPLVTGTRPPPDAFNRDAVALEGQSQRERQAASELEDACCLLLY